MNDHTIGLVKEGFDLVEPIAPRAAALFYENLVEAAPSLQPLIKGDGVAQGARLMQMVELAVSKLDSSAMLSPTLRSLGRSLASHGFEDRHYDTAGGALLKTLRQCIGAAYTPDLEEAWTDAYRELAGTMKEASASPAAA
jgi:hemoglobin-like flavoprotein